MRAMVINPRDNVAVMVEPVSSGGAVEAGGETITANNDIRQGHKIALKDIAKGEAIIKYSEVIGLATADIKRGDWVHSHNVFDNSQQLDDERMARFDREGHTYPYSSAPLKQPRRFSRDTIMGYPRKKGPFGIRNQVVVISIIQCANNAVQRIAAACHAPFVVIEAACGEFPGRAERTTQGFISAGLHPNVYGALVVSLGCQWTKPEDVMGPIREAGRECHHLCIQEDGGFAKVVEEGIKLVRQMQENAAKQEKVPCPVSGLIIGGYNGGSDWTSGVSGNPVIGEALDWHDANGGILVHIAGRGGEPETAASYEVAKQLVAQARFFNEDCRRRSGVGLSEVNPSPGNKAGGLTTYREKNLGSHMTAGHAKIRKVIFPGEIPEEPGAYAVNQAQGANDSYAVTSLAMCGAHIIIFGTGRGNPIGCLGTVVIKQTGNPEITRKLWEMLDYSAAPVLEGKKTIEECGAELYELVIDVADGKITKAEMLEDYSYTIPHGTSYNGDYGYLVD